MREGAGTGKHGVREGGVEEGLRRKSGRGEGMEGGREGREGYNIRIGGAVREESKE